MSFLIAKEVNFTINEKEIFCNQLSLSQEASLNKPIQEGEVVSIRNQASAPKRNLLSMNYYLTGKCPLKDYIFTNHKNPLSGRINDDLQFNQGYLESYRLSATPNSPLRIQATIFIADEVSGNLASISSSSYNNNLKVFNYNDSYFSNDNLNITDFSWNFTNTVEPIYYQKNTGHSVINPDRIHIGQKEISADFTSDSQDLILGFTGTPFNITFTCKHPSLNITEEYPISGFLNKKDFSISTEGYHQTTYSLTQNHINEEPKIGSVTTSSYPAENYITIQSPNLNNGYFSLNDSYPLVEKVVLGDRELNFKVNRGASFDTITGIIPADAINGQLSIHTTKGLVIYPTQISLAFSGIGVSGFWPETGAPHSTILVSGSNFHRISQVLFNGVSANFNVYDTTGIFHKLIASVPENTTIGKINVISSLRNVSGLTTGLFYPAMQITGFTPTGTWSGTCVIEGLNFSGITNVYFNDIRSPSFVVNSNNKITSIIPGTGAGYTKGYIKLSGHRGMVTTSKTKYQPVVRITGINLISGGIDEDIAISGIFDPDFLCSDDGGHRLSFGDEYSVFYRQNNFTLTGLIPTGSFGVAQPALFEPDGIGKYPPYTQNFIQIAAPIIEGFGDSDPAYPQFSPIRRFSRKDLIVYGKNFNYFFGLPSYIQLSGIPVGAEGQVYTFNDFERNSNGTRLIVKNVRVTGAGNFQLSIKNAGGTSSQFFYVSTNLPNNGGLPEDLTKTATANMSSASFWYVYQVGQGLVQVDSSHVYPSLAIDNNGNSYAMGGPFGPAPLPALSGWFEFTFNQPINFGVINCYQNTTNFPSTDSTYVKIPVTNAISQYPYLYAIKDRDSTYTDNGDTDIALAQTGMMQLFDLDGNILRSTGINFNSTLILDTPEIVTGVKRLKLFRNDGEKRYLAFSTVNIYD